MTPQFPFNKPEFALESYLGRANFNIMDKYLLTASIRRDASSKLSPEGRVGYFPALAFAWKLRDEFFRNNNTISDLKLRLGWGKTGQQDGIDYYSYLARYSTSQNSAAQYQLGNTFYNLYRPEAYNDKLQWESTTTTNLGLDFGFLKNRINGSFDIYQKKTNDLLSNVPTAPGSNFGIDIISNVGAMEVKGLEFAINTTPVVQQDFSWDLGLNFALMKAKITKLRDNPDPSYVGIPVGGVNGATANSIGIHSVGHAPYTFYTYKQVYDANGNPIQGLYADLNRDGVIDANDRYTGHKPAADLTIGASTGFTYKKFNVGVTGHGAFGNYLYNNLNSNVASLSSIQDQLGVIRNSTAAFLNTNFATKQFLSDYYIEDASFFRIDNINLGYNFGNIYRNKASLRLNFSVQNVVTFTKYSGLDPESSNSAGTDYTIYPRPRTFTLGASIDF